MLSFIFILFKNTLDIEMVAANTNVTAIISIISAPNIRPNTVKSFISPPPMPPSVITARNKKTAKVIADEAMYILQFSIFSIKLKIPNIAIAKFNLSGIIFFFMSMYAIFISNIIVAMYIMFCNHSAPLLYTFIF